MSKQKTKTPHWLDNLREHMSLQGLNPRSLSLQAGLNPTAVRDMLEGRTKFPRYDTVQALAATLKLSPAQLMGDKSTCPSNENGGTDENLDLLVEIITRLQEESTSLGHNLAPRDFAAMAATLYRQFKEDPLSPKKRDTTLQPKIHDLLAYESMKKRSQN